MERETMKILFFIKKNSLLKNGEAPIIVRLTINGVEDESRIQRSIDPKVWDQKKGFSKGRTRASLEINDYIDKLRGRIHAMHKELMLEQAYISPSYLLASLFGKVEDRTVLKTMLQEIKHMEDLTGIEYEKITINRYWNCYRSVEKCVKQFYKKDDIVFPELTPQFIRALDKHLRTEKRLCNNTLVRYMKCFKKITNMAIDEGWLKKNPFRGIRYSQESTDPTFLSIFEVKKMIAKEMPAERLAVVKDLFLFCSFTGLAFVDAKDLTKNNIYVDNDGEMWIRKGRTKIKKNRARCISNVPLLKPALEILKKYETHPLCRETGKCLPFYCNQTMNNYLKEIAALCGINKNLTTHVARHTFGTTMTLANKVALSNVSKMMGHTSTRMTEHYARVMDQSIKDEMKGVEARLSL